MSAYLDWKVGDRVVCVDDNFSGSGLKVGEFEIPIRVPMIDEVLTIASMSADKRGVFLGFEEIELRQRDGMISADVRFFAGCFRKLVEHETDISIFTQMLTPSKQRVGV